ncbi:MAG: ABC transporter substrate-binding protein [Candidatus Methanoplasma sp.]|jgi:ABC-type nitrate/sulfonate/bicarbonate transport system substrate-binding protein|nr:ABC transporter substrate-binding protein [Candidatus Methanoplasma sp.]
MAKKTVVIAVAIVAILVVAAVVVVVASGGNDDSDDSSTKYTIKANVSKDCTGTPFYVGVDIGYFDAYDIDFRDAGELEYRLVPTALVGGQTDIYDGHPITIINLIQGGANVKGVVMTGYEPESPTKNLNQLHMHWLVDKTRNDGKVINNVDDLFKIGHKPKIAVLAEGVCADLEVKIWLRDAGYTESQYEIVVLSDPYQEAALQNGSIDVAVLHPPFYSAAESHKDVTVIATSYDTLGQYAGVSLLVFTEDFIKKNPETVRQFIKAYKAAQNWSNDHQIEAGILTAETIGLDAAVPHWASPSGKITDADLQPWIDAMVEFGLLKAGEFKPSDLYTTQFADTWVDPVKEQPLNPYNSDKNNEKKWFDKTSSEETVFVEQSDFQSAAELDHGVHIEAAVLSGIKY